MCWRRRAWRPWWSDSDLPQSWRPSGMTVSRHRTHSQFWFCPLLTPIVLAVSYLLGSHLAVAMATFSGWAVPDGVVRVLLVCSFTFWAAGALDPSMRRLADPLSQDPPTFSTVHFVLIEIGMFATPVLVAQCARRGTVITAGAAIAAAMVSGVLAAYVGHLLWQRGALERGALHDPLTGLSNRTLFADRVARAIAHARRHDLPVAVLLVDLDHFKKVNDSMGHTAGDVLLREVARRLKECVREEDTVARLGGDEFAVLLPHVAGIEATVLVGERLLATFAAPVIIAEQQILVTASIGISLYPDDGPDLEALIEGADAAMYRAKELGRPWKRRCASRSRPTNWSCTTNPKSTSAPVAFAERKRSCGGTIPTRDCCFRDISSPSPNSPA
ncbi:MAG: GGDEF domain-containing protein [Actinobacteria bacterium]|nr:MAG: GGDEF domain-containing protein [Actinomycetota bacterium]